jgi:adenylate kinase
MTAEAVIITGTPAVGKTAIAKSLASNLSAQYVNLTELIIQKNLILEKDEQRDTLIINERLTKKKIRNLIEASEASCVVVDGHYAQNVVPKNLVNRAFVIRRDPIELQKLMKKRKYSRIKIEENLACEILDVCLVDALNLLGKERVCEIDATGKSLKVNVNEISSILEGKSKCRTGVVDWLGQLESKGLLDEFLKI